jgi:predicted hydrolase (HD superfamily)
MTREQAIEILHEFTKSESLRKHALAVEACMAAYARHHGEERDPLARRFYRGSPGLPDGEVAVCLR